MKKAILLLLLIISNFIQAQNEFETNFNDTNRPSSKSYYVTFTDDKGNLDSIPVIILKGKNTGPVFTMVSGVHGYEYPPIIAAQELLNEFDTSKLTGTIIMLPMANPSAFFGRTPFVNPKDDINLNRTFPGNKSGSITERIADFITNEIVAKTDIFLDIHGGDANEDLFPFACYYNNTNKPKETAMAKKLAEASGFSYVVSYPYTLKKTEPAKYAFKQAVQDGKIALSLECGKLGQVQSKAVDLIKMGVYNMLSEMNMYNSEKTSATSFKSITEQSYLKSEYQGILTSDFKAGDSVTEGEIVGQIQDIFGTTLTVLKAPNSGIILYKIGTPPVNKDETVMCIGYGIDQK
ncbi:succinylglutamate desuccinylase/aspartoacylase family protein [Maribacter aquivivus]|uniref:succinylglutamate desuccinylase/aspartoacylase family protein n=1 Tax=Maribacter aquivivus TaxID=228958 RepID=UPI0024920CB4|nr:M14 family metallopeptidase [Maribacter aquivivus]